jgi:hypothetical protein
MRRLVCLLTVLALALATVDSAVAGIKVKTNKDPDFDFAAARTWAWSESGAGVVRMLRTADDDSESVRQRLEPTILDAVTQELTRRGFTAASAGAPDVTVTYYLLVTVGSSAQVMGQFLPAVAQWGLPPFAAATQSYSVVQQGSLVIDLASPKMQQVVWRGVAQAEIDETRSDTERKTRIQEAVRDLIRRVPRK